MVGREYWATAISASALTSLELDTSAGTTSPPLCCPSAGILKKKRVLEIWILIHSFSLLLTYLLLLTRKARLCFDGPCAKQCKVWTFGKNFSGGGGGIWSLLLVLLS